MSKKRKIDYIIEQTDDERLIFRFYPRQSHCHSFGDEPPKTWRGVYKVYYSYAIIKQIRFNPEDKWESEVMFYEDCDECSVIDAIGRRCLWLADGLKTFKNRFGENIPLLDDEVFPIGAGVSWIISKKTWYDFEDVMHTCYNFSVFDYFDKGFRFIINEENMKSFGEYLLGCCEYMLAHGDPI